MIMYYHDYHCHMSESQMPIGKLNVVPGSLADPSLGYSAQYWTSREVETPNNSYCTEVALRACCEECKQLFVIECDP